MTMVLRRLHAALLTSEGHTAPWRALHATPARSMLVDGEHYRTVWLEEGEGGGGDGSGGGGAGGNRAGGDEAGGRIERRRSSWRVEAGC